eukprot:COSAG03_NODE_3995_length_1726_cov_2.119238_2_plen_213_part_00
MAPGALPPLTPEELRQFVLHGYLIKRGVLDQQGCAAARDAFWASNRSRTVQRSDRASWVGGFPKEESVREPESGGRLTQSGAMWIYREPMGDPLLLDLVPRRVMPWLEQLLGEGQVTQPEDGATEVCLCLCLCLCLCFSASASVSASVSASASASAPVPDSASAPRTRCVGLASREGASCEASTATCLWAPPCRWFRCASSAATTSTRSRCT